MAQSSGQRARSCNSSSPGCGPQPYHSATLHGRYRFILIRLEALAGIAVAFGGVRLVKAVTAIELQYSVYGGSQTLLPGIERLAINGSVLTFTVIMSVATGLLFASLPAVQLSRPRAATTRSQLIGPGVTRTGSGIRRVLTVSQLGLATILLVGACLLTRSFVKLANVDLGYSPMSALTFELILPEHLPEARKLALANELVNRLVHVHGVGRRFYECRPTIHAATAAGR